MKKVLKLNWLSVVFISVLLYSGCQPFEKMGKNLSRGVSAHADSIGYNLVKGAGDRLSEKEQSEQLKLFLDSLITTLGLSANKQVLALKDSILNEHTRNQLLLIRDDLLGQGTRSELAKIRNELLGEKTRKMLEQIIAAGRDQLLSDSINQKVIQFRDILLGPETNQGIRSIVDSAMSTLINRYHKDLKPELKANLSFVKRNAVWFIVLIGLIALVLVAYFYAQKRKYLELTSILTHQIHQIPDQGVYDAVTSKIQEKAREKRLEPRLRELLKAQGLVGEETWMAEKNKKR